MNHILGSSRTARVVSSSEHAVLLALACVALLLPPMPAAADPVLDRYGRDFTKSELEYAYDMKFNALAAPATEDDVKAKHAIFTLSGMGESRVWKLPVVPLSARWNRGKRSPERPWGLVLQAEELLVDGSWRRYYGLLTKEGAAVVPAEELDFGPRAEADSGVAWWSFTGGFAIGMDSPGVKIENGHYLATPCALAEPIVVRGWVQNTLGTTRSLPGDLHRAIGEMGHSFRKGVRIHLAWAPFDPRRPRGAYPRDRDFAEVPAAFAQHEADERQHPGLTLETFGAKQIWEINLHELFAIRKEGHYRFGFTFSEEAAEWTGKRDCAITIQGFDVGTRPREFTVAELNDEIGCLGGKVGQEKLRKVIVDHFSKPVPDSADAAPLPANFPDFERVGFLGGNMSGDESKFTQFWISNQELIARSSSFSRASVRAEFEKRMSAEKEIQALRFIYALIAAEAGSEIAGLEILEALKSTDYGTLRNAHTLLVHLLYNERGAPDWVVELALATIADDRFVTGTERTTVREGRTPRVSYLADESGGVVGALGSIKCRQAVPLLIDRVRKSEASRGYVIALGDMGDERAKPVLMEFLVRLLDEGNDVYDRLDRIIFALAQLKAMECVPILIEHLEHISSIEALESLGDPRALPPLKALIAAEGVITRDAKPIADYGRVRRHGRAKIAVAVLEPGDTVERLCELLTDSALDEYQHTDVVWKLARLADPRAVPLLLADVRNAKEGHILHSAISALSSFRCPEAVDALIECLAMDFTGRGSGKFSRGQKTFTKIAHDGLKELTEQDLPADVERWKSWWAANRANFRFKERQR